MKDFILRLDYYAGANIETDLVNMNIRKLETTDTNLYKEFRLRAFKEASASFSESYEDEKNFALSYYENLMGFDDEHFTMGCYIHDQQLIGITTFRRDRRSKARHKGYISTMYVDPDYRGRKVARNLLEKILALAKSMEGLEQIHLWVLNPRTSPARSLYLNLGWKSQGTIVQDDLKIDGKYVDAEYMVLRL